MINYYLLEGKDFRAARIMSGLEVPALASASRCGKNAIYRLESKGIYHVKPETAERILEALRDHGVTLEIDDQYHPILRRSR